MVQFCIHEYSRYKTGMIHEYSRIYTMNILEFMNYSCSWKHRLAPVVVFFCCFFFLYKYIFFFIFIYKEKIVECPNKNLSFWQVGEIILSEKGPVRLLYHC